MRVTIIREGEKVRVLEVEGELPPGQPVEFFSRDELELQAAREVQARNPGGTEEGMVPQALAESYREWMEETEWDAVEKTGEGASGLSLGEFKP